MPIRSALNPQSCNRSTPCKAAPRGRRTSRAVRFVATALIVAMAVTQVSLAQVNRQGVIAAGPDVVGGYASTHIIVRVAPGVQPLQLPDGRWTFHSLAGDQQQAPQPQQPDARAGVGVGPDAAAPQEAIAEALRLADVQRIAPMASAGAKNIALRQQYGLDRYYRVELGPNAAGPGGPPALAAAIELHPQLIESAQLDGIGGIARGGGSPPLPNDPSMFPTQWNMHNVGQFGGVVDADIDAPQAWQVHTGSASTIVAVLDSGVQSMHPELAGRVTFGPPTHGCGQTPPCTFNEDQIGHGTRVAGILAAKGNNAMGIAGVNWNAHIMSIRCVDAGGMGDESHCADAVLWAADNGAHVINMSLAYGAGTEYLRDSVAYAYDAGVLPIAATGNSGPEPPWIYPAAFPKCMGVGSINRWNLRAFDSNTGPFVDVVAPGVDIYSTFIGSGYNAQSGTSFATPHVSGVASLLRSYNPSLTIAQIEQIIKDTADDLGPAGFDHEYGWGRLNAHQALLAGAPQMCPGNVNGDGAVNVADLLAVISAWGACPPPPAACPADIAPPPLGDGAVNVADLLAVISNWGPCE